MWKELLESLSSECEFNPPTTPETIAEGEFNLTATFPEELRTILGESDGVYGEYKLGLLWPLDRIVQDNLMFRSHEEFPELYMPFESLLFLATMGVEISLPSLFWRGRSGSQISSFGIMKTTVGHGLHPR